MKLPIPYHAAQQAMALAMAEVLERKANQKRIGEFPYARAFFRYYFGTSKPTKAKLCHFSINPDHTIPQLTEMLDELIESNGQYSGRLDLGFVVTLFPSLAFSSDSRFHNRFFMDRERDSKIEDKKRQEHNVLLEQQKEHILTLNSKELSPWVSDNEHRFSDHEMRMVLEHWYVNVENHSTNDFYFDYYEMSAREVAFDLSLPA